MNILRTALSFVLLLIVVSATAATDSGLSENQIKAAYLFKFASYVEWPSSTFASVNTPITIGVVSADEVAAELYNLTGDRAVNERALRVKSLKLGEPVVGVQILFIGGQELEQLKHLLSGFQLQPLLTVTEAAGGLDAGSIINFVPVADHIRFEVSVAQAERSALKISARLLAVAQKIETGKP